MSFKYLSESLHAHFNTGINLNRYTAQFTLEHDFIRVIFKFFTRLQNLDIGYHLFIHSSSVAALSWSGSRWLRSLNWEHRIWGRNMCCITEHHAHTHTHSLRWEETKNSQYAKLYNTVTWAQDVSLIRMNNNFDVSWCWVSCWGRC